MNNRTEIIIPPTTPPTAPMINTLLFSFLESSCEGARKVSLAGMIGAGGNKFGGDRGAAIGEKNSGDVMGETRSGTTDGVITGFFVSVTMVGSGSGDAVAVFGASVGTGMVTGGREVSLLRP